MALFQIAPEADADLDRQYDYLVERNPTAARRYYSSARATFQQLADFPGIGSSYHIEDAPNLAKLRMAPIKGFETYLVFYLPMNDGILIVRVIHEAQNVATILSYPKG